MLSNTRTQGQWHGIRINFNAFCTTILADNKTWLKWVKFLQQYF